MKSRNIILLQPLGSLTRPSGYMRSCYLEPISLEYLAAAVEESGFNVEIMSDDISEEQLAKLIRETRPFAIGFSVFTYMYENSLFLARISKLEAEKLGYYLFTIFGGHHPSALPEAVANESVVDFVIINEGEITLCELLHALENDDNLSHIKGLVYKKNNRVLNNGKRKRIQNLDLLPRPKRYNKFIESAKQYQISFPPPSKQIGVAQVAYSRGCCFSCSFCSSENMWGKQIYWRSPSSVLDEIEELTTKFGTNLVYFPDLTLNASREKLLDLCSEFKKRHLAVKWWGLFRVDRFDEELIDALVDANCVKISIGIESPNEKISQSVKSSFYETREAISNILNYADKSGLIIKAFLIIGFLQETQSIMRTYIDELAQLPIDELRITFATPFPGTQFWKNCFPASQSLLRSDWHTFTTEQPIIPHPNISNEALVKFRDELIKEFYLTSQYENHARSKIQKFPHLLNSWIEYFNFIESKGVFLGQEIRLQAFLEGLLLSNTKQAYASNC